MTDVTHTPELRHLDGAAPRGYEGFEGTVAPRSSQSSPWWPAPVRAPEKAPNVVVILLDDMGFSDVEPFGSEIRTPAIQALADEGYRLTNFHVAPVCSPTRAALMTGCNPHRAGVGSVANMNPGYPGIRGGLPEDMPTLAETFRANGYATLMVGKWHLTPETSMHDGADKSTWPIQRGFDRYFGSLEGFTTMYHPHRILRDNSPVTEEFADDDYLTDRLTDEAIDMIDAVRGGSADRPFFLYFAHNAVHGPVQAKAPDIDRHRGAYDEGWDRLRASRFESQKRIGLFADDAEISPSGAQHTQGVPAWDDLDEATRELYSRHMEVYAAAITAVDDSVARIVAHLKEIGEYDNTIIVFTSDNGGTNEGGVEGTRSYFSRFHFEVGLPDDWVADVQRPLDDLGGPRVFGHYPAGWAHVSNTPFRLYKGSVHEGGIHSPLIVSWPAGLARDAADAGIRRDFAFVADLAPTLEELSGVTRPATLHGRPSAEPDGASFAPTLRAGSRPRPVDGQHVTFLGHRSYFEGRFKLVGMGWAPEGDGPAFWRLYDIDADPAEVHDLASDHPEVVADLAEKWRRAAWSNTVFPLPDEPTMLAKVPSTDLELEQPVRLRPGSPVLERVRSYRLIAVRSFAVEARFEGGLGEGVIVAHGDQGGGYVLFAADGSLHFSYNAYGDMRRASLADLGAPTSVVVFFDAIDGFAWHVSAELDGTRTTLLERVPMLIGMAPFTGISVGRDAGGPVDWDLHVQRGQFPHCGGLRDVRYVPGPKAPYNHEIVVAIDDVSARLID